MNIFTQQQQLAATSNAATSNSLHIRWTQRAQNECSREAPGGCTAPATAIAAGLSRSLLCDLQIATQHVFARRGSSRNNQAWGAIAGSRLRRHRGGASAWSLISRCTWIHLATTSSALVVGGTEFPRAIDTSSAALVLVSRQQ